MVNSRLFSNLTAQKQTKNKRLVLRHELNYMYTLYAIPNYDTVKKARTWLAERGIDYQFYDYKKRGADRPTIERWLTQKPWEDLVNRAGTTWKKLPDAEKPTDAEGAIALMLDKPSVIRRPLIELNGRIIALGFKADDYEKTFP